MDKNTDRKRFTLLLPLDVHTELAAEAKRQCRSLHSLILFILVDHVTKMNVGTHPQL